MDSNNVSDFLLRERHSLLCRSTTREAQIAQDGFTNLTCVDKHNKNVYRKIQLKTKYADLRQKGVLTEAESALTVYGKQDPLLQAWVIDARGNILVRGPLLLQGGLYHFHVRIFTIDSDAVLYDLSDRLKFDSYVSVGSVYSSEGALRSCLFTE